MDLMKAHKDGGFRPFKNKLSEKKHICPASGQKITEMTCRDTRIAWPQACINCLIPLADTHPLTLLSPARGEEKRGICKKCGLSFPAQEARAGYTTCEHCGEGDAA